MSENHDADRRYPSHARISALVFERPWAILESKHREIRSIVTRAWSGENLTAEEIQARIGLGPAQREDAKSGAVAIIPVYGVITPKADLFTEISGGTSVQRLQASLRATLADDDVTAIVLDVDSPGGVADLLTELAAEIRAARGTKPIVASVNTMCASAAYWIASQADEVVLTPSASVGSVGVFAAHDDISKALEEAGIKTTLVHARQSPYKVEGNPYEPLSEEALAEIQKMVDECCDLFLADVAAGRGVTVEKVANDFGKGRMLNPQDAIRAGMADRIDTFENTVKRLMRGEASTVPVLEQEPPPAPAGDEGPEAAKSGLSFGDAVESALRAFDSVVTGAEALRALT